MERTDHDTNPPRDDAVVEALLSPRESSFVDALLTLGDEAANGNGVALSAFQAALARKMRATIEEDGAPRHAA